MSFLDLDVSDAKEYKTVRGGLEYQLKISAATIETQKPEKGTGQFLKVGFAIVGDDPFTKDVTKVFMLPTAKDDVKTANNRKLAIQRFKEAFGIDPDPRVNLDDIIGNTGWAILDEEESKEFGFQNTIRKFIVAK